AVRLVLSHPSHHLGAPARALPRSVAEDRKRSVALDSAHCEGSASGCSAAGRGPKRHPGPGGRRSVGVNYGLGYPMSVLLEAVSNRLSRVGPNYGGDMNPSQDSRLRLTLATLAIAVLALGLRQERGRKAKVPSRAHVRQQGKAMQGNDGQGRDVALRRPFRND